MSDVVPARLLRALSRFLRRPPSDWMGPDPACLAAERGSRPETENLHDVVCLPGPAGDEERQLADLGHRVFAVVPSTDGSARPYRLRVAAPRLLEVTLPFEQYDGLDALRHDHALGATACVVRDPSWQPLAERLASRFHWPIAAASTPDRLAEAFPRLSIVVVTYGNRELNRLCLESIFARTEWPNREVVVVDNGSTDGTRELLDEASGRHRELRTILFDENRGFPAAANAGLSAASGRFLVLLNNDTVVTRGWATALVRHLAADPQVGLVGPVTNAIANDARVGVGYSDLADLPSWAARFVREHDGETFPMASLAFFCVAMRAELRDAVGLLDERFGIGMFEDGDYCRRVRQRGLRLLCARDAFVHHWQMASFRRLGEDAYLRLFEENRRRFREKWGTEP